LQLPVKESVKLPVPDAATGASNEAISYYVFGEGRIKAALTFAAPAKSIPAAVERLVRSLLEPRMGRIDERSVQDGRASPSSGYPPHVVDARRPP
jgi:hypothetical protein